MFKMIENIVSKKNRLNHLSHTSDRLVKNSIMEARRGGLKEAASYETVIDFLYSIYTCAENIDLEEVARQKLREEAVNHQEISVRGNESSASILLKFAMGMNKRKSRRSTYKKVLANAKRANVHSNEFKIWVEKKGGIEACSKLYTNYPAVKTSDFERIFAELFDSLEKQEFDVPELDFSPGLQLLLIDKPDSGKAKFLYSFNNEGLVNRAKTSLLKTLDLGSSTYQKVLTDNTADSEKVASFLESINE